MLSAMPLMTTGDHLLKVVDFIGICVQVQVHVQLQVAGRILAVWALSGDNKSHLAVRTFGNGCVIPFGDWKNYVLRGK